MFSAVGNSTACGADDEGRRCVAASATGSSKACVSGPDDWSRTGYVNLECAAVSLLGSAASCEGAETTYECAAVSGTRDARACTGSKYSSGCYAVSGTGEATACDAAVEAYLCTSASGTGESRSGKYAIAGLGDSRSEYWAASAAGNATAPACEYCIAVAGTGDATGHTALSITGHATGTTAVSGCDTLAAHGRAEACVDPV